MQRAEVETASSDTKVIIDALAADNNIPVYGVYTSPLYYDVAVAGFNFIDDQCATYFDKLFYLQRDRQFAQGVLQAGSQASAAVLTITRASEITFGVVAAAFGLSSSLADTVAGSFLFQLPPATTYGFVKELQRAYRSGVNPASVTSPSSAYHLMQDYLAICLPPNIEARLIERVANTRALPESPIGGNASPMIQVADRFVVPVIRPVAPVLRPVTPAVRPVGNKVTAQASRTPQPQETIVKPSRPTGSAPPEVSQFFLAYDPARDTPAYINDVLQKLCAPAAGQGQPGWVAKVRALIRIYESTPQFEDSDAKPVEDGKIDEREGRTILASAACSRENHNYFEKKTFGDNPPDVGFITGLYKVLGKAVPQNLDGMSLTKLRPDIREANTKLGLSTPNDFVSDQVTPELEAKLAQVLKQ
jgi:hypothetical protein